MRPTDLQYRSVREKTPEHKAASAITRNGSHLLCGNNSNTKEDRNHYNNDMMTRKQH